MLLELLMVSIASFMLSIPLCLANYLLITSENIFLVVMSVVIRYFSICILIYPILFVEDWFIEEEKRYVEMVESYRENQKIKLYKYKNNFIRNMYRGCITLIIISITVSTLNLITMSKNIKLANIEIDYVKLVTDVDYVKEIRKDIRVNDRLLEYYRKEKSIAKISYITNIPVILMTYIIYIKMQKYYEEERLRIKIRSNLVPE